MATNIQTRRFWRWGNSLCLCHDLSLLLKVADHLIQFFHDQTATINCHLKHSDDVLIGWPESRWLSQTSRLCRGFRRRGITCCRVTSAVKPLLIVAHYQTDCTVQWHVTMFWVSQTNEKTFQLSFPFPQCILLLSSDWLLKSFIMFVMP